MAGRNKLRARFRETAPTSGLLFENRRQARKVRFVTLVLLLWCLGCLYWAVDSAQSYGLQPGDGGVLRPPVQRYAMAALLVFLGLAPMTGMILYNRRYLTRIVRDDEGLELTLIGFLWPFRHRIALSELAGSSTHEGRMHGRIPVHAPWLSLRVKGQRVPFIIDQQAEQVNNSAIQALIRSQTKKG